MHIAIFKSAEEANTFISQVKLVSLEYKDNEIIVLYSPAFTPEYIRAKKIREDKAEALAGIEDATMHLQYLEIVGAQSEEDAKIVEGSIKSTKQNIKNYQAKLEAIKLWESA